MVGTWQRLAHASLSDSADVLSSGTFTAKDNLRVECYQLGTNSSRARFRFNSSTSGYSERVSDNGGSPATQTGAGTIDCYTGSTQASPANFITLDITNKADKEKLVIANVVSQNTAGANAPYRLELVGKWTNTSDQITEISINNVNGSGDFLSGTYMTVWGASDDIVSDEKQTLADATATVSPVSITSATGWDTTNAGSNLSIDSSGKITQGNMTANGRLTYDLGSNLQGTWTIDYDFQRTSSSGGNVRPMAVATNTGSINDSGVDNNAVGQYGDTNFNAFKKEGTNADSSQGWIAGTTDMRYIRLSRTSATNFRMEVFTNSDRTTYDTSSCGSGCSGNSGIINQTISLTGGLRYLVSGNGDAGSSHTGTIENIKVYDGAIAGTTVPSPPPVNTRYEEVDTRKIYRWGTGGTIWEENATRTGGEQTVNQSGWQNYNAFKVPSSLAGKKVKSVVVTCHAQTTDQTPTGTISAHIYNGTTKKAESDTINTSTLATGSNIWASGTICTFTGGTLGDYTLQTDDYVAVVANTVRTGGGYVQTASTDSQGSGTNRWYRTGGGSWTEDTNNTMYMTVTAEDDWKERNTA